MHITTMAGAYLGKLCTLIQANKEVKSQQFPHFYYLIVSLTFMLYYICRPIKNDDNVSETLYDAFSAGEAYLVFSGLIRNKQVGRAAG